MDPSDLFQNQKSCFEAVNDDGFKEKMVKTFVPRSWSTKWSYALLETGGFMRMRHVFLSQRPSQAPVQPTLVPACLPPLLGQPKTPLGLAWGRPHKQFEDGEGVFLCLFCLNCQEGTLLMGVSTGKQRCVLPMPPFPMSLEPQPSFTSF